METHREDGKTLANLVRVFGQALLRQGDHVALTVIMQTEHKNSVQP